MIIKIYSVLTDLPTCCCFSSSWLTWNQLTIKSFKLIVKQLPDHNILPSFSWLVYSKMKISLFSKIFEMLLILGPNIYNSDYAIMKRFISWISSVLFLRRVLFGLQYVHGSLEDPKTLTHHKLIHAATERVLTDNKTVAEENLKDKGMLLAICQDVGRRQPLTASIWPCFFYISRRSFAAHKEKTATDPSKDGRR